MGKAFLPAQPVQSTWPTVFSMFRLQSIRGLFALVSLEASENDLASTRCSVETLLFGACPSVERRGGLFVGHVGAL